MDKQRIRAYYDKFTRPARTSRELQFQRDLTQLDPGLHLRWSYLKESWCVYYDHHGFLSSIRAIAPDESFRATYLSIAKNGSVSKRDLIEQHQESIEANDREAQKVIEEAQYQARHELGNMASGRLISMVTDSDKSSIVG